MSLYLLTKKGKGERVRGNKKPLPFNLFPQRIKKSPIFK